MGTPGAPRRRPRRPPPPGYDRSTMNNGQNQRSIQGKRPSCWTGWRRSASQPPKKYSGYYYTCRSRGVATGEAFSRLLPPPSILGHDDSACIWLAAGVVIRRASSEPVGATHTLVSKSSIPPAITRAWSRLLAWPEYGLRVSLRECIFRYPSAPSSLSSAKSSSPPSLAKRPLPK